MTLVEENLEVIVKYIPEEFLFEIYRLKRINNLGVRCSRIEEIKRNREILSRNLLKPINRPHFLNFLFEYFTKVTKKNIVLTKENLQVKQLFNFLIISLFNNDKESFEVYSTKLKNFSEKNRVSEKKVSEFENLQQEIPSNKIIKKLEKKINNFQVKIKEKDEQINIQKSVLQEKINSSNKELKEIQRGLSVKDNKISELEFKQRSFINEINQLKILKNEMEIINNDLNNNLQELEIKFINALKREIKVIGIFNLRLITNPNIQVDFLSIEEFLKLSVIKHELWILQYTLTPREKYTLKSSMKEIKVRNNVVKINSNSELLKLINIENPILSEVSK
ncbi:hypothetical protein [Sporosarcina sp. FA9]|uniref:hypothetical protein n=1 Tax=Sporosarcina sp. FA9 TaxID=3413030 RepID=UPI003F660586